MRYVAEFLAISLEEGGGEGGRTSSREMDKCGVCCLGDILAGGLLL